MYLRKYLLLLFVFALIAGCSEDDGSDLPVIEVVSEESVKPNAVISIKIMADVPLLLATNGITGRVSNGEGVLERLNIDGEDTSMGTANFEFTAGNTENTSSFLEFTVLDLQGNQAISEVEIEVTALEITEVVVINEGNFLSANGGLDLYQLREMEVDNSKYPASATIQSAVIYQDNLYLVTNAPDALDMLNAQLESTAIVTEGLDNPVDFAAVENTGYVTNWGDINTAFSDNPDSYVAIVDLQSGEVTDSVELDVRPQGIVAFEDQVFVALEGGTSVAVIDANDNSVTEIQVPAGPSDIQSDELGMIWVLCNSGSLVSIDPASLTVVTSIDGLTTGGFGEKMAMDGSGNLVYYLAGSNDSFTGLTTVYQVNIGQETVDVFMDGGFALYGIGVNPESNEVYIGDSNAFQSTGTAFRYDSEGNMLDEFATGIGPKGFIFR